MTLIVTPTAAATQNRRRRTTSLRLLAQSDPSSQRCGITRAAIKRPIMKTATPHQSPAPLPAVGSVNQPIAAVATATITTAEKPAAAWRESRCPETFLRDRVAAASSTPRVKKTQADTQTSPPMPRTMNGKRQPSFKAR